MKRSPFPMVVGILALGLTPPLALGQPSLAQSAEMEQLLAEPFDDNLLEPGGVPEDGSILTSSMISQSHITVPSLWWARQQFGSKLLDRWFAFPGEDGTIRRVDLLINQPVWNASSYVQRYAFVNQMGRSAQDYGYDIRVFNRQLEPLAAYRCGALQDSASACEVMLPSDGPGALEGRSSNLFGAL